MTLALILRFWREAAIGALILVLVASCVTRDHRIAAAAVAQEHSRQADSVLRVITPQLALVDTKVVRDTVTIRREIARQVTLRDTLLEHLTDTVRVKEFVRAADSVQHACSDLANDCVEFRRIAQLRFDAYEAKLKALPVSRGPTRRCGFGFALGPSMTRDGGTLRAAPIGATAGLACRW